MGINWIMNEYMLMAGIIIGWTYRFDIFEHSIFSLLFIITLINLITFFTLLGEDWHENK